ncbi:MAG: hypothetical protein ACYDHZ_06360 [Dehalococcoidia bacterium]
MNNPNFFPKIFCINILCAITSLLLIRYNPLFSLIFFIFYGAALSILVFNIFHDNNQSTCLIGCIVIIIIPSILPLLLTNLPWEFNYHHILYADYIIENGYIAKDLPLLPHMTYQSWPGAHILMASIYIIMPFNMPVEYYLLTVTIGIMVSLFLYLFVLTITKKSNISLLSLLFYALLVVSILNRTHVIVQELDRLGFFIALFIIFKRMNINSISMTIILFISIILSIISHHLDSVIFLFTITIIALFDYLNKTNTKIPVSTIVLWSVLLVSWWIYLTVPVFISDTLNYFIIQLKNVMENGYMFKLSWPSHGNETSFYPSYLAIARLIQYFSLALLGILGITYSILRNIKHKFYKIEDNRLMQITTIWSLSICLLSGIIFITPFGGTALPGFRIITYLVFPLSISAAFIIIHSFYTYRFKYSKTIIIGFCIITLILGPLTAFVPQIYTKGLIPQETPVSLETFSMWINDKTNSNTGYLADNQMTQSISYFGNRIGLWGNRIDELFKSQSPKDIDNVRTENMDSAICNYIALSQLNTEYRLYNKWGELFDIPNSSLLLNIDNQISFICIYNNNHEKLYYILYTATH